MDNLPLVVERVDWKKDGHQTNPWLCTIFSPIQGPCKKKRFTIKPNLCGYVISHGLLYYGLVQVVLLLEKKGHVYRTMINSILEF
jgi:hypothetical protein